MTDLNYPQTDMGNALRFATDYGNKVRYDHTSGKWLAWDGRRWCRDGGEGQWGGTYHE